MGPARPAQSIYRDGCEGGMDLGGLEVGYELLKRVVVVSVLAILVMFVALLAAIGAAVASRSLAPLAGFLAVVAAFYLYVALLEWRAFSIFHRGYGHGEFRLAKYLALASAVWTVAATAGLSAWVAWMDAAAGGDPSRLSIDPGLRLLAELASWLVGLVIAALWLKVYSRLAEASGVDYFRWVGYAGLASAVLSPVQPLSGLIAIVSLVLLYIAAREAAYRLQEARR